MKAEIAKCVSVDPRPEMVEPSDLQDSAFLNAVVKQQRNNDAYGPFPQGELALPLEAYDSPSNAIIIIQQRSPVIKGMMVEFAKNMAGFLAGSGKKHIIVLSSLDFGKWQKVDMSR
ncbi:hypothetical protein Fmac_010972 [Flemingia macrophylla]|uniref:Proteasome assembly chaperone 2 n=1 Tax=Flemingia macrophylla TaxID=520843 RepID=A0ABD1MLD6_9FABA